MTFLIIGAGQAAASCTAAIRKQDQTTPITIIGDEVHPPYQRPPLSKKYLGGEMERDRLFLRPMDWYRDQNIDLKLNTHAVRIDRQNKRVELNNGEGLDYTKLVLATGSRPRMPQEWENIDAVYALRSIDDVDLMRDDFKPGRRALVIGGGYIGLEAAAIARKFGVEVCLVEAAPRILGRVAAAETADAIRDMHMAHGVEFIEGIGIQNLIQENGTFTGAELTDGRHLEADFAIIGIGIVPNSELAEAAGIDCDQGILVNEFCQTNDADIYAAGDCCRIEWRDNWLRIESVGNAIDQGENVAKNLLGTKTPYRPKPWFWSDQYDVTLQIVGLNLGYDQLIVRAGNVPGQQSHWYFRGEQLLAVDAIGDPRAYMIAKRMLDAGKTLPKAVVADPDADLKPWM